MGAEPIDSLRLRRDGDGDPFATLRRFLQQRAGNQVELDHAYPFPLRAGVVGYIGYECGRSIVSSRPSLGLPDLAFDFYPWILATDRRTGETWLSVLDDEPEKVFAHVVERLRRAEIESTPSPSSSQRQLTLSYAIDRSDYLARVRTAQEHITAGDAYEICLTNQITVSPGLDRDAAWALYRALHENNPAPFGAILDLKDEAIIVSSSPERFLSVDAESRVVESRPIKGTRPRSADAAIDARLKDDLRTSEKDLAENAMIVDLVRNDLGRVCKFGSIVAPNVFRVESYATVHQLVSTISGELTDDHDAFDAVRAAFPPGSMTGAPKIEAMSILERLEPVERGVYSGAIGYFDVGGNVDLSVVIRTIVVRAHDGLTTFSVGGAIVSDSIPETELEETDHKAAALIQALKRRAAEENTTRRAS